MKGKRVLFSATVAAGTLLLSATAGAVDVPRVVSSSAGNYCQSALPVFDGNVRKRPLSVQNEGSSNAFITCAFHAGSVVEQLDVRAHNDSDADVELTCTAVAGWNGTSQANVKTVLLPAGGQGGISWAFADFPGATLEQMLLLAVSCNLPAGTGVDDTYLLYTEEIGAPEPT